MLLRVRDGIRGHGQCDWGSETESGVTDNVTGGQRRNQGSRTMLLGVRDGIRGHGQCYSGSETESGVTDNVTGGQRRNQGARTMLLGVRDGIRGHGQCDSGSETESGVTDNVNRGQDGLEGCVCFMTSNNTGAIFLIVCFTSYFVFSIAVLPHSPGVVYYHLLL